MEQSDKLNIGPSLGDIERGIKSGSPKRELYQDLSNIADKSRNDASVAAQAVKEGLKKEAEKIKNTGK